MKFLARGSGYTLFLIPTGAVLRLRHNESGPAFEAVEQPAARLARTASTLRVRLQGANLSPKIAGVDELPGRSNYLFGDARAWRTNVPTFERVRYESVYPGIDLVYYGDEGQLEYDFRLAAGADPRRIRLRFEGARGGALTGRASWSSRLKAETCASAGRSLIRRWTARGGRSRLATS